MQRLHPRFAGAVEQGGHGEAQRRCLGGRAFGEADPVFPPDHAIADARSIGAKDSFYRLFLIPGMAHCQGGATPHAIGQSLPAPDAADDAEHDVRGALETWVEQGRPPTHLIATMPGDPTRTTR